MSDKPDVTDVLVRLDTAVYVLSEAVKLAVGHADLPLLRRVNESLAATLAACSEARRRADPDGILPLLSADRQPLSLHHPEHTSQKIRLDVPWTIQQMLP